MSALSALIYGLHYLERNLLQGYWHTTEALVKNHVRNTRKSQDESLVRFAAGSSSNK